MRILIVATAITLPGEHGGSTHVGELQRGLGRHADVLVLAQRGSTEKGVVGIGTKRRFPLFLRSFLPHLQIEGALAHVKPFRPDVIYERGSSYGLGALLSERLGIPMICMLLDEHVSERSLARANKIIATTDSVVPERVRHKWVPVSWGANAELFRPDAEPVGTDLLPPFEGATLGYAGSLKRWHDLDLLVDVATRLRDRKLRILLVGDGPERARVEALTESRGVRDRFVFVGAVPYEMVPRWLARAELCVAPFRPAHHDASRGSFTLDPLKVFEYLALGKPTITTATDNIGALLDAERDVVLVPAGDVNAFAEAISALLDDPARAQAIAENGRAKVLARYTWAAHTDHLFRIMKELVES